MSFKDLDIKIEYRSNEDNIVKDFYLNVLRYTCYYDRAVGFFSSSALADISMGISLLASRNGRIRIIASPELSEEDIRNIKMGYKMRDELITQRVIEKMKPPHDYAEKEKLNLLASLIADGILDIRIAVTEFENEIGMYHEKMGLLYDTDNNVIAFSGSMNESSTAYNFNLESIDVFCNWKNDDANERAKKKMLSFNKLWEGNDEKVRTLMAKEITREFVRRYKTHSVDYNLLAKSEDCKSAKEDLIIMERNVPQRPVFLKKLRNYQENAIEEWKKENYKGIFVMATGTGKTYTGLAGAVELYNHTDGRLAMIIVCPQQHLVDQWVEDLRAFNIEPIIGHSQSVQKNYREKFHKAVLNYRLRVTNFFCFICTNATFSTKFIQNEMENIKDNSFLLVDEAHNFGAEKIRKTLEFDYTYRLALSATFDRHNDEEGTKALSEFFGKKCIDYTLDDAIKNKMLTPYYYYPIPIILTDGELDEYKKLTHEISKHIIINKSGKTKLTATGKIYAQKRARLVAAAKNKEKKLVELIEPYKNDNSILVYCGAANIFDDEEGELSDIRQIDEITKTLGRRMNMKVSQFTSKEDAETRKTLIKHFESQDELQALVAIKCLDEGVNIPSIKTAFILASSTNPKEYIQRRGRVLRTYPGKEYAEIFDFITLPRELDEADYMTDEEQSGDLTLVKNEINRMIEFKKSSLNPYDSDDLIDNIIDTYSIKRINEEDYNG